MKETKLNKWSRHKVIISFAACPRIYSNMHICLNKCANMGYAIMRVHKHTNIGLDMHVLLDSQTNLVFKCLI